MAGDLECVPLLIGMGMRELSMQPAALLTVRELIGELAANRLRDAAEQVFSQPGLSEPLQRFEQILTLH
jgi:phosphoenolpyruvate-protein kinase (PTS system EI component)